MPNAQILIVEDESIIAKDLQFRLQGFGYVVPAVVSTGEGAVSKAAEMHPDLVLVDIKLRGDMDGVAAAEQIRARFDIPVVYLTAYSDQTTLERAKITEPFGYIIKPFEERELQTNIEIALYKHQMDRRLKENQRWLATTLKSIGEAVIAADVEGLVTFMNPVAEALTGWKQAEALGRSLADVFIIMDEQTGSLTESLMIGALREGVVVGGGGHSRLMAKDGTETLIDHNAAPIRDDKAKITGVVLVFRDITERQRAERRQAAQYAVTRILAESTLLGDAAPQLLQAICESVGWEAGALWCVDRSNGVLRCTEMWHNPSVEITEFEMVSRQWTVRPGDGVLGRVWASGEPVWSADVVEQADFIRAHVAGKAGLHGGFAFPILLGNEVLGVIEFYTHELQQPDQDLLQTMATISNQIGQFIERQQAEQIIRQRDQLLRGIFHSLSSPVAVLDRQGTITYVSQSWERFAQENEAQMDRVGVGVNYLNVCRQAEDDPVAQQALAGIQSVLAGAAPSFTLEYPCCAPTEHRWFVLQVDPMPSELGGVVITHMDITERKRAEEALRQSEDRFRATFEKTAASMASSDIEGRFLQVNPAFCRFLGYTEEELLSLTVFDVTHPEDRTQTRRLLGEVAAGLRQVIDVEKRYVRKDGAIVWGHTTAVFLSDATARPTYCVVVIQNITESKWATEELRKAKEAAEAASRSKSQFLANMSHEIRTPMNTIIGMADLLWESHLTLDQREYVRLFRRAGNNLLKLINDIIDLSKVEAGRLDLERTGFDLSELVERTAELLAVRAHEKGLELTCHVMPAVPRYLVGDPHRLRQVLVNLIGNAIKFTEQGEIIVQVENDPHASQPGQLMFSISDTGVGIPVDKLGAIFESFMQVDSSTTRKYEGTGLGLAISKRLVELMGGCIGVESRLGQGSTFYFTAQFGVQVEPIPRLIGPRVDLKGMKVLVVDDNARNRLMLRQTLASWGAVVQERETGERALMELRHAREIGEPYELLLLDGRMPGLDGFELAERVKADMNLPDVTIMMLTSDSRNGDIRRVRELGIAGYLIKPIKQADLLNAVMTAINRATTKAMDAVSTISAQAHLDQRPVHILLVEDTEDNQLLIQFYLKPTPFQLDIAENGAVAVEKFKAAHYDLVLMDMQMPVMDGYSATQVIREWEAERGLMPIPIIALTAHALKEEAQKSLDAGCTAHITKPIKKLKLIETIREFTRGATS
jgi:PAS domain S-box-containing protein